jgi:biopolymer transport protein ExbD
MNLTDITFGYILGLLAMLVLFVEVYNKFATARNNRRAEKKLQEAPVETLTVRVDAHDKMLANDKRRLDETDERLTAIRKESSMTLRGVRAILSHEINGNSNEKLQKSYDEIDEYLLPKE